MNKSKNTTMMSLEDREIDELSYIDLLAFISRNFRVFLGCALIGVVVGLVLAYALPAQWEASASIKIGQLGNSGSSGSLIEPALQVVDRIKNISFQKSVLNRLGTINGENSTNVKTFNSSLKVKLEKSELISISLDSYSPEDAKAYLEAVIEELKNIHTRMSESAINRWNQELVSTEEAIKKDIDESNSLNKSLKELNASEKKFPEMLLKSNILLLHELARERELQFYLERKFLLQEQLSSERTFATEVLGQVEVSGVPVFPKKPLFALAGIILGLILGVLLSIINAAKLKAH